MLKHDGGGTTEKAVLCGAAFYVSVVAEPVAHFVIYDHVLIIASAHAGGAAGAGAFAPADIIDNDLVGPGGTGKVGAAAGGGAEAGGVGEDDVYILAGFYLGEFEPGARPAAGVV